MKTNNEPTVEQKELISRLPDYSIKDLAKVIKKNWEKVNFGAVPYLDAMFSLESIHDYYFQDTGKSVVLYFLCNASTWRGVIAKAVKAELNKRAK